MCEIEEHWISGSSICQKFYIIKWESQRPRWDPTYELLVREASKTTKQYNLFSRLLVAQT